MAQAVVGTWNYESGENMEAYMTAVGVPDSLREIAKTAKPIVTISNEGNVWTIKTTVGDKVSETKYPENEEVDSVSLIGQPIKATMTIEGDTIQEVQKANDFEVVIKRMIQDGNLISVLSTKGVTATLKFAKA